jgi:hypothetical protein
METGGTTVRHVVAEIEEDDEQVVTVRIPSERSVPTMSEWATAASPEAAVVVVVAFDDEEEEDETSEFER